MRVEQERAIRFCNVKTNARWLSSDSVWLTRTLSDNDGFSLGYHSQLRKKTALSCTIQLRTTTPMTIAASRRIHPIQAM